MKPIFCLMVVFAFTSLSLAQDMPLSQILIPGEGWKKVEGTFKPIGGLTGSGGKTPLLLVYDNQFNSQAILKGDGERWEKKFESNFNPHVFATRPDRVYRIDAKTKTIKLYADLMEKILVKEVKLPMTEPSTWRLTADTGSVFLADAATKYIWMFRIDEDGGLSGGEKYLTLRTKKEDPRSETSAIRLDDKGRIYAATTLGVQVFDPTGRLCGVLTNPTRERITAMDFGGENYDLLYIACGSDIFYRKLNAKAEKYLGK